MQITGTPFNPNLQYLYNASKTYVEWQQFFLSPSGGYAIQKRHDEELEKNRKAEEDTLNRLRSGDISFIQPINDESLSIILKRGENCYCQIQSVQLLEDRAVRYYQAGTTGVSVRVMKGVSLRVGGIRGSSESQMEKRQIDHGTFVITDKRIVFSGTGRNSEIPLSKIVSLEEYSDGIGLIKSGKAKTEYYVGLNGPLAAALIKALISNN